jgi:hypothetical protein
MTRRDQQHERRELLAQMQERPRQNLLLPGCVLPPQEIGLRVGMSIPKATQHFYRDRGVALRIRPIIL